MGGQRTRTFQESQTPEYQTLVVTMRGLLQTKPNAIEIGSRPDKTGSRSKGRRRRVGLCPNLQEKDDW